VHLIAHPFTEYSGMRRGEGDGFLRKPIRRWQNRYLDATAQYLEMYRGLLGLILFQVRLVENFWETGYRHAVFRSWASRSSAVSIHPAFVVPGRAAAQLWGNGVFVDFAGRELVRGFDRLSRDHLIAEQRGQGADHRRASCKGSRIRHAETTSAVRVQSRQTPSRSRRLRQDRHDVHMSA